MVALEATADERHKGADTETREHNHGTRQFLLMRAGNRGIHGGWCGWGSSHTHTYAYRMET